MLGLKQGVLLVVPACGASSALEGCPCAVYLGLATLAVSTCCTGVGTLAQCAVVGSARNALGTQQCCLVGSKAVAASRLHESPVESCLLLRGSFCIWNNTGLQAAFPVFVDWRQLL